MFNSLIRTDSRDYSLFIIRVVLGFVMLPHGMQKLFGWFGGLGVDGTVTGFSAGMGIPSIITYISLFLVKHSAHCCSLWDLWAGSGRCFQ